MSKRIVTIDTVTGHVLSQWCGGDEQTLGPVAGRTHIEVANEQNYYKHKWNGTAFEVLPRPAQVASLMEEQLWRIETKIDELLGK